MSQSVLDALADAETLLEFHRGDYFSPVNYALLAAMIAGSYAIEPPADEPGSDPEYRYAKAAASAAFRAVPGLRGE